MDKNFVVDKKLEEESFDSEKILTVLVEIYCRQEGILLKNLFLKRGVEEQEKS